jgi:RNA polymerase sigma-70 factor, ECF subfamily
MSSQVIHGRWREARAGEIGDGDRALGVVCSTVAGPPEGKDSRPGMRLISASERERNRRFGELVLPLLPAAFNTARWLVGNRPDAEDVVQDAYVRALHHFEGYVGGDARSWLLRIVRNCAYDWFAARRSARAVPLAPEILDRLEAAASADDPESAAQAETSARVIRSAMAGLPSEYREVLVLRELEGLSYRAIAEIADVPIGTVMSRLSRARDLLAAAIRANPSVTS